MAIVFDAAAKRIILDDSSVSAVELYSRSVDWLAQGDNMKYGAVFRQVGGDDLGGGLSIPPYFFLQNGWRVRPMEADQVLVIDGNLFVDGGGDPVVSTLGSFNVLVKSVVPVLAQGISTSGSTGPSAGDIAAAVWQHATGAALAVRMAETWGRLGLDPSKPVTQGNTQISFGDVVLALSIGAGGSGTITRQ